MKKIALFGKKRIAWVRLRNKAAAQVRRAVQKGQLSNLKRDWVKCTDCTARATVYDHRDYNKPLDVQPVCFSCNVVRGTNAPALPQNEKKARCIECGSSQVLYRVRAKEFWCRVCGHAWPAARQQRKES